MKKEHEIIMLSSDRGRLLENGALYLAPDGTLIASHEIEKGDVVSNITFTDCIYQHLYILSSEPVTSKDNWVITDTNEILNIQDFESTTIGFRTQCKKIVATTNRELKFWTKSEIHGDHIWSLRKIDREAIIAYMISYNDKNTLTKVFLEMEQLCHQTGIPCGFPCNGEENCAKSLFPKTTDDNAVIVFIEQIDFRTPRELNYGQDGIIYDLWRKSSMMELDEFTMYVNSKYSVTKIRSKEPIGDK